MSPRQVSEVSPIRPPVQRCCTCVDLIRFAHPFGVPIASGSSPLRSGSIPLNMSSPAPKLPVPGADPRFGRAVTRTARMVLCLRLVHCRSTVLSVHGAYKCCSCGITLQLRLYSCRVYGTAFLDVPSRVFETSASLNLDTGGWLALPDKDLSAVRFVPFCKLTL
jgi:hypothetical protein